MAANTLMLAAAALAMGASATGIAKTPGFIRYPDLNGQPFTVTYDNRSAFLTQNGVSERTLLLSGCIHYPRATPAQWQDLFQKAVNDGMNQVQTYVFWYGLQPKSDSQWDEVFNFNLTQYLETAKQFGLFVNLRIGPYICAETDYGGFPVWLNDVPSLSTRTANDAWEAAMGAFFQSVVTRYRAYFADRGGPIIVAQVENELNGAPQSYVDWCGQQVVDSGTANTTLWVMCNGQSSYPTTVNSCNGFDCTSFIEGHGQNGHVLITQPAMWTEFWSPWYQQWTDGGAANPTIGDVGEATGKAFIAAKWFARGGFHLNYYMYAGLTNFGKTAGAGTTAWYYVTANIAFDGLSTEPFRSHMAGLHGALASVAGVLLYAPAQANQQVNIPWSADGNSFQTTGKQYAFVYTANGQTIAFLENAGSDGFVQFGGKTYSSKANSVVLVGADGSVVFDTATVAPWAVTRTYTPLNNGSLAWQVWSEAPTTASLPAPTANPRAKWTVGSSSIGTVLVNQWPYEQLNITEDDTEHMYYATTVTAEQVNAALAQARDGSVTLSLVTSKAEAWEVFVNGALSGIGYELSEGHGSYTMTITVNTSAFMDPATGAPAAATTLTLLSESMGIDKFSSVSNGPTPDKFYSSSWKGITSGSRDGGVVFGGVDLTLNIWTMTSGLVGEAKQVYTAAGAASVQWSPNFVGAGPLAWYRVNFTAPPLNLLMRTAGSTAEVNASLLLNITGLGRGHLWVNGWQVSRFYSRMCGGSMCQPLYAIPPDILLPGPNANMLVLVDTEGATDPTTVQLVLSQLQPPAPCTSSVNAGDNLALAMCQSAPGLSYKFVNTSTGAGQLQLASNPNLCWTLNGTNPSTGAPNVALGACDASQASQLWKWSGNSLINSGNNNCADLPNQDDSVGTRIETWACNGGSNQEFTWDAAHGYVLSSSNLCAGVC